jgi:non-ribosomal peptide synthetase component F
VVNSKVTSNSSPSNIGNPVGVHLWVVDPEDYTNLVAIGCVGELLIQGPTLSSGYLDDPRKTSSTFVQPPPWACRDQSSTNTQYRLYRTGDLVFQNEDGSYNIVGRKDNQVKVRFAASLIRVLQCCRKIAKIGLGDYHRTLYDAKNEM